MSTDAIALTLFISYKIATLFAGLAIVYMGFRLFHIAIAQSHSELEAKTAVMSLTLKTAAPGTLFALFGATIICMSVYKGLNYIPDSGLAEIGEQSRSNISIPLVLPDKPPAKGASK